MYTLLGFLLDDLDDSKMKIDVDMPNILIKTRFVHLCKNPRGLFKLNKDNLSAGLLSMRLPC